MRIRTFGNRSMGEHSLVNNHPTKDIHLTESQARQLCKMVSDDLGWPLYSVSYTGRITKGVNARVWREQRRMIINQGGERVCTILHELAHEKGHGHDHTFKHTHLQLLDRWEKFYQNHFQNLTKHERLTKTDGRIQRVKKVSWFDIPFTFKKEEPKAPKAVDTFDNKDEFVTYVADILESDVRNNIVTMFQIGKRLSEEGSNNRENLGKVKDIMKLRGYTVK